MKKLCKSPLLFFLLSACILCQTGCRHRIDKELLKREINNAAETAKSISSGWEPDCVAQKYDMTLQLDTDNNIIAGYEDVVITNTSKTALPQIEFRYYAEANASESEILSISNAETNESLVLCNGFDDTAFFAVIPGDGLAPGQTMTLRIQFATVIPKADDRFGYHEEKDLGKMYILTFWAPQLAICDNGIWDSSPYFDEGESTYNMMSDYTVHLTAPADYVVAASGRQTTVGETTTIEAPKVREMAIVLCNFMERTTETESGVAIHTYRPSFEKYHALYDVIAANAKESIKLYSSLIGPYIYDELDVVPSFISEGGMEMPGLILEGLPSGGRDVIPGEYYYSAITVAHEIAHQWFYCAIGNDQYNEPWLDESFATYYSSFVYHKTENDALKLADEEEQSFADAYVSMMYDKETNPSSDVYWDDALSVQYINLPCSSYDEEGYGMYVYNEGGYFLDKLSAQMGDSFSAMMSDWYQKNKYGIVHGSDFVKIILQYDASEEVKALINKYISDEYLC